MMREEFTERTKVEVSGAYYRDVIEPMYMKDNVDKDTFCADWLKRNKQLIIKSHLADFNKMNMDVAVMECNKAENEENKLAAKDLKNRLELMEMDLAETTRRRDAAEKREKELEAQVRELQENANGTEEKLQTAAAMLNEKDTEIMKLKAMLFDLMNKAA